MKKLIVILAILALLSGCTTPQAPIASVTPAPTLLPTATLAPTSTPAPLPSATFTPTPDLRVIVQPAQTFKLALEDLPKGYVIRFVPACKADEPECKFPSDRIEGPHLNFEVMQDVGNAEGGRYINDTGRIEGWYIYFYNDVGDTANPDMVMSEVIRFTAPEGARKYIASYTAMEFDLSEYTETQEYAGIGDAARAYVRLHRGTRSVLYEFSYYNIVYRLLVVGLDWTVTTDFVQGLAQKAHFKLQAAKFSSAPRFPFPPTLTPQPDAPNPDERVIADEPLVFILTPGDLPAAGKYYLALDKSALNRQSNVEITRKYQEGLGVEYIRETGRMDGWSALYKCGTQNALLPAQISHSVIVFETAQGAQKHVREYSARLIDADWHEGTPLEQVGDATRVFTKRDGLYISYRLEFSYRNYVHSLTAYGMQAEVDPAFMEMVAFTLLQKLQNAPLE